MDDELVQFEMREIKANVRIEETSSGVSFAAWFQTRSNIRRFLMIVLLGTLTQWAVRRFSCCFPSVDSSAIQGNGIISYYLVPVLRLVSITAPPQTAGINGGLSIFQWICALAGGTFPASCYDCFAHVCHVSRHGRALGSTQAFPLLYWRDVFLHGGNDWNLGRLRKQQLSFPRPGHHSIPLPLSRLLLDSDHTTTKSVLP